MDLQGRHHGNQMFRGVSSLSSSSLGLGSMGVKGVLNLAVDAVLEHPGQPLFDVKEPVIVAVLRVALFEERDQHL